MSVYEVFIIWYDDYETCVATYTTKEEAEKHRAYIASLPWSMRPGSDWVVVEKEVFDKFELFFTDDELAPRTQVGRRK